MSHAEQIIKLRKRVLDAVSNGIVDHNLKDFYEATLLQILNESERHRQKCVAQAEALRKQAAVVDGQASAYSAMGSIIYDVLNSYVLQEEKAKREELTRVEEERSKQEYIDSLKEKEDSEELEEENESKDVEEVKEAEELEEDSKPRTRARSRGARRGKKS
jgi:activator of 2-hydroxyglutaryl-CoA dehydratase